MLGFGVWVLGLGVWPGVEILRLGVLGLGVYVVGLGVWGLRFRFHRFLPHASHGGVPAPEGGTPPLLFSNGQYRGTSPIRTPPLPRNTIGP